MKEELDLSIRDALRMLYRHDKYLIDNCSSERGIVFHFGGYLKNILNKKDTFKPYNVDYEYNRNMDDPKKLSLSVVIPDLIIHKRGESYPANLLVVEFKGWWNNQDHKADKSKIKKFMNDDPYKYEYGLFVVFEKEKAKVEELKITKLNNKIKYQWSVWAD